MANDPVYPECWQERNCVLEVRRDVRLKRADIAFQILQLAVWGARPIEGDEWKPAAHELDKELVKAASRYLKKFVGR